jgi:hypothetical protein
MQQFQFKIIGGKYVALLALQVWFIPYDLGFFHEICNFDLPNMQFMHILAKKYLKISVRARG